MQEKLINEIKEQGKSFPEFSNKWNVMQQLIDIVTAQPESAEIIFQDIKHKEMNLNALVNKVLGKRLADPREVMKVICDFYKIPCPAELPPEAWRNSGKTVSDNVVDLLDFM